VTPLEPQKPLPEWVFFIPPAVIVAAFGLCYVLHLWGRL